MNTAKLRGAMAERGVTGVDMAALLNCHLQTFYNRMKDGQFTVQEAQKISKYLNLPDPLYIFFDD